MVFQAILKDEEAPLNQSMATAPVKSQSLHNFSFPLLKWGKNQMNNHRYGKPGDSARESPPLDRRSSNSEADFDGGYCHKEESDSENRMYPIGSRSIRRSRSFFPSSSSSTPSFEKPLKNSSMLEDDADGVEKVRGKLLIRIRTENKEELDLKDKSAGTSNDRDGGGGGGGGGEVEESMPKLWNLRPRRAVFNTGRASKDVDLQENHSPTPHLENLPKSLRLRGFAESRNVEKKEKQRFWISLSHEEIEEDFFMMTGSRPARRPKKRAKNVQKQMDNTFPGLWLIGITPDSYKVPDSPPKR